MEEKDSQEDFDAATMAMLSANLPDSALSSSTPDPRLQKAWQDSTRTNQVTPILKEELRLRILAKRLQQGEPEIDTSSVEPKKYELTEEEKNKKDRRKEQNRRAAKKCRDKRKMKKLSDAENSDMLKKRNQQLRDEMLNLKLVAAHLQKYIEQHITPGQCHYGQKVCDTQAYHAASESPPWPSLPDSSSAQDHEVCSRKRPYPFAAMAAFSPVSPSTVAEVPDSFGVAPTESYQDGISGLAAESLLQTGADLHPAYFSSDYLSSNEGGGLVLHDDVSSDVQDGTVSSQSNGLGHSQMLSTQQPFFLDQCQSHDDFGSSSFECYKDRLPDSASVSDQECIDEDGARFLDSCGPSTLDADSSTLDNFTNFICDYQLYIGGEPQHFMHVAPMTPSSPSPPPIPLTSTTPNSLSMPIPSGSPPPIMQEKGRPARPVIRLASSAVSVPSPYSSMQLTSSISPPPSVPSPASHGLPESPPILHGLASLDDGRYFAHFASDASIMGVDLDSSLPMSDLSGEDFGG